ncbi:hypothetical protein AOLI_G00064310 [Acnodon oligacanthus]
MDKRTQAIRIILQEQSPQESCWAAAVTKGLEVNQGQPPSPGIEGQRDLIRVACFWNTISRLSICQRMMHEPRTPHRSCCHSPMYAKARRNTVVQINSTITPSPSPLKLNWRLNIGSWSRCSPHHLPGPAPGLRVHQTEISRLLHKL